MITVLTFLLLTISGTNMLLFPCTVFYASDSNSVLFGNNEDWSDPDTRIWFFPAESGKHGWIKFGFAGGFPQGGMNEHGLCWDGTGCAYREMPYSTANKEKYPGPLMQKVIQECSTTQEARSVFASYYCEDQFKAQYLLGDSTGASMIVEGDSIIIKSGDFQVLTNFYQSHPELGGYPCWRYNTAVSMLQNSNSLTTELFGGVLSETHQEGRYPTQYSNIYDLKNKIIYLFYYHNFREFVKINVKAELSKGVRSFNLPELFSEIHLISPEDGSELNAGAVTFKWEGKRTSQYDLVYSTDPDFSDAETISVGSSQSDNQSNIFSAVLVFGVIFLADIQLKKKKVILYLVITILFFSGFNCKDKITSPDPEAEVQEISMTIENLENNTLYYWKVVAHPEATHEFYSESIVRTFNTVR